LASERRKEPAGEGTGGEKGRVEYVEKGLRSTDRKKSIALDMHEDGLSAG
jgi:hypothetical protein